MTYHQWFDILAYVFCFIGYGSAALYIAKKTKESAASSKKIKN